MKFWFNKKAETAKPAAHDRAAERTPLPALPPQPMAIPGMMSNPPIIIMPDYKRIGREGSAKEIAGIMLHEKSEVQKELYTSIIQTAAGNDFATLHIYLDVACALLAKAEGNDARDRILISHFATPLLAVVDARRQVEALQTTVDKVLANLDDDTRKMALDRTLRFVANADSYPTTFIDALAAAGGDVHTDGERPLVNAVMSKRHGMAFHLIENHGADLEKARQRALISHASSNPADVFETFSFKLAARRCEPALIEKMASLGGGYDRKTEMLKAATAAFHDGDPAPLRAFMRGYLRFKRGEEFSRSINDGYMKLVVEPVIEILKKHPRPQEALQQVFAATEPRDREAALSLVLRQACAKLGHVGLCRDIIAAGADPQTMSNRPLVNALSAGHTDVALMLCREHGANVADALLDTQINSPSDTALMQKICVFMASQYQQAMPRAHSRPALKLDK